MLLCSLLFPRFAVVVLSIGHVIALPISSNEVATDSSFQSWKRSEAADVKSAWFILAGDSTTANPPADKGGGGWGRGFLRTLQSPAGGVNYAQNGATTVSFRQDKHWDKVISETKRHSGSKTVYVTIQFGHNDQKKEKGISIEAYKKNLRTMIQEVLAAKGKPILVTPLTRRNFNGANVQQSLSAETAAKIEVASSSGKDVVYIDLNQASTKYMNQIGQANAEKYNRQKDDRTHLNSHGTEVFGRMVADLVMERLPDLAGIFNGEGMALSSAIKAGKPA